MDNTSSQGSCLIWAVLFFALWTVFFSFTLGMLQPLVDFLVFHKALLERVAGTGFLAFLATVALAFAWADRSWRKEGDNESTG